MHPHTIKSIPTRDRSAMFPHRPSRRTTQCARGAFPGG